MRQPHARAEPACARRPSDSRPGRHPGATRWQGIATAMAFEAQAWATARTACGAPCVQRLPCSSPWCQTGSHARLARHAAEKLCPARRVAGSSPSAGASTKPTTLATRCSKSASPPSSCAFGKRSWRSRTSARDRRRAGWRRRPCQWRRQDRAQGACSKVELMEAPWPPERKLVGVMPSISEDVA